MGKVIRMGPFIRDCRNCHWRRDGGCRVPGGWKFNKKFECVSFHWSREAVEAQRKELRKKNQGGG